MREKIQNIGNKLKKLTGEIAPGSNIAATNDAVNRSARKSRASAWDGHIQKAKLSQQHHADAAIKSAVRAAIMKLIVNADRFSSMTAPRQLLIKKELMAAKHHVDMAACDAGKAMFFEESKRANVSSDEAGVADAVVFINLLADTFLEVDAAKEKAEVTMEEIFAAIKTLYKSGVGDDIAASICKADKFANDHCVASRHETDINDARLAIGTAAGEFIKSAIEKAEAGCIGATSKNRKAIIDQAFTDALPMAADFAYEAGRASYEKASKAAEDRAKLPNNA